MTKKQMMRKRLCGALYVLTVLVTAGLFVAALCGKGVPEVQLHFFVKFGTLDCLNFFLPLFVAEYLLWRTAVYFFCTAERSVCRTVFAVLYGLLGLGLIGLLVVPVPSDVKWWIFCAYGALCGIDGLADIVRTRFRKEEISRIAGRRKGEEFFFILIVLSAALFLMLLGVALWLWFFPSSWLDGFMLIGLLLLAPPLLLAEGLLRKSVLALFNGTGGKVFPYLYGGIAMGIFLTGGNHFFIGSSFPWVLVCVYGVVKAVDTLLNDVRRPCGEGDQE